MHDVGTISFKTLPNFYFSVCIRHREYEQYHFGLKFKIAFDLCRSVHIYIIYNVRRRRRFCRCLFRIGSDGILIKLGLIGHLIHYMYVSCMYIYILRPSTLTVLPHNALCMVVGIFNLLLIFLT